MSIEGTQHLLDIIQRKYKSFEEPEFGFVSKALSSQPYAPLVSRLRELFKVDETTEPNDDVSFGYVLSRDGKQWGLELSMVERYAVVFRISSISGVEFVLSGSSVPEEHTLRELLLAHHFIILDQQTLEQPCPLKMHNTDPENMCIYQALFSDVDVLPWKAEKRANRNKQRKEK